MFYNLKWLQGIARQGLADMAPAIRQAFNEDPSDDRLDAVYGAQARRNVLLIALGGLAAGMIIGRLARELPFGGALNWPAIITGGVHAALIRRYLFRSGQASDTDFPWLAASLVPGIGLLMFVAVLDSLVGGPSGWRGPALFGVGSALMAVTRALGVAASLAIAVATLCFSRQWLRALRRLAVRLFVFRLTVWLMVLILIEIGIVGLVISAVAHAIIEFELPQWLPDLLDGLSYASLMSVLYLAIIGATWTVCRSSFPRLLEVGQVDVLQEVQALAVDPVTRERAAARKAKKRERSRESRHK